MRPLDPTRLGHGLLYARALGLNKAAKATGISKSQLSHYRKRAGVTERLPNPGNAGNGKLSLEVARTIRAALAAGEKQEALAAVYGVHRVTISKIGRQVLYPEPAAGVRP